MYLALSLADFASNGRLAASSMACHAAPITAPNDGSTRATLANSAQSLRSAQAQLELQDAAVVAARAGLQKAQADMNRFAELVDEGSVSLRERDQARAALQQAQAGVRQAQAQRAIAAENVRSVTVGRGALEAQVAGAEATKGLAEFELSSTIVGPLVQTTALRYRLDTEPPDDVRKGDLYVGTSFALNF